jgi:hypothetical protein
MISKDKYLPYGLAIVAGVGVAVWAGLPPSLLIVLVCPLMMVFMMRGMHGGQGGHGGHDQRGSSSSDSRRASGASQPWRPDGSHERIDLP